MPMLKKDEEPMVRFARFILEEKKKTVRRTFQDLKDDYDIDRKTVVRYVAHAASILKNPDGTPVLSIKHDNRTPYLVVNRGVARDDEDTQSYISLLFALRLVDFMKDTSVSRTVKELTHQMRKDMGRKTQQILDRLPKKIYQHHAMERAMPDQGVFEEILAALVNECMVDIVWKGVPLKVKPLSLLIFKEGLYLVGVNPKGQERNYGLGNITKAKCLKKEPFDFPVGWSAEKSYDNRFGLVAKNGEKSTYVKVIFNKTQADYAINKKFHPNQSTQKLPDGRVQVTFDAVGFEGIVTWALSFADLMEVVEPQSLRTEVRRRMKAALLRLK